MKTFYFNNSSLQYMSCAKRYYFQVVQGLLPPPGGNKYTAAGLAFHKMMQLIGTEKFESIVMAVMMDKANLPAVISKIPEAQQITLAQTADKIYAEHPELFQTDTIREHYFEQQLPDEYISFDHSYIATLAGTIDNISVINNTLVITDYKSTSKPIDGGLVNSYKLTSQRFFYLLSILLSPPPIAQPFIDSLSIAWRYCYVHVESGDYYLESPQLVDTDELQYYRKLIIDKALLAAALHADPSLAYKEGILTGQCFRCPFQQICLAKDDAAAMANWYYGRKPYTAKHDE